MQVERHASMRTTAVEPRASGGRRSEVKEEDGRHERSRPPDAFGALGLGALGLGALRTTQMDG
jgi:hypothetical protein